MATAAQWWDGARPRTLPAALAPVAVGSGVADLQGSFRPLAALLALVVALSLQIGVNYANDYSDGVRGTDDERVGPLRLTAGGAATAAEVRRAAFLSFAVATLAGLVLVVSTQAWWLLLVGAACLLAAWYYTGGSSPYGYRGLGEVSVFVFFGLVAVTGTAYVQTEQLSQLAVVASVPVGLLAVSLLVVNNLRDVPTDAQSGKLTLAVRLGAPRTRVLYAVLMLVTLLMVVVVAVGWAAWALLALAGFVPVAVPVGAVLGGATGRDLVPVLRDTGRVQLLVGLLLGIGLALG
ncbi:MAG: 1,4-dihydroxy-2-naphthoate polyprenyltransferase [Actinomycetota bacterium]|nr:1,4-dihydroxy-2-naphthoate polyprenyltransferase [Actinomycetota bacterium]MDH4353033.1 1,4-dihydroxy-2-naphthoate polyprenyltransferase [Actinomycetota bacterium]MDH5278988.1 1,4-dihydroxy-2-naphthoate polyprenyltransferase [Actinomycetota bacterium]